MDLGLANLALKLTGMFVWMLLFCRNIIHPATRAGEIFGRPYAARHAANMHRTEPVFQP